MTPAAPASMARVAAWAKPPGRGFDRTSTALPFTSFLW